jgi:polysaccharide pyruvyl transferase WcaK-like protein
MGRLYVLYRIYGVNAEDLSMTVRRQPNGGGARIALLGLFGIDNYGNEASLAALLHRLRTRLPDAWFLAVCSEPSRVSRDHRIATVHVFRWCIAARLCGTSVAFVCVGAGPIEHRISRWFLTRAARHATYRSFRDPASKDFLLKLGVPVSYYGWDCDKRRGAAAFHEYVEKITRFSRWALRDGHVIRLLIGDHFDSDAASAIANCVRDGLTPAERGRFLTPVIQSFEDVLSEIAQTDIVVGTRFHNMVAALMLDKPAISIGYAVKNSELLTAAGLGDYCHRINDFDDRVLVEQFREVCAKREQLGDSVRRRRIVCEEEVCRQLDALVNQLKLDRGAADSRVARVAQC